MSTKKCFASVLVALVLSPSIGLGWGIPGVGEARQAMRIARETRQFVKERRAEKYEKYTSSPSCASCKTSPAATSQPAGDSETAQASPCPTGRCPYASPRFTTVGSAQTDFRQLSPVATRPATEQVTETVLKKKRHKK